MPGQRAEQLPPRKRHAQLHAGMRQHVDERIDGEQPDLSSGQIAHSRLRHVQALCGLGLCHPGNPPAQLSHETGAHLEILCFFCREAQIGEHVSPGTRHMSRAGQRRGPAFIHVGTRPLRSGSWTASDGLPLRFHLGRHRCRRSARRSRNRCLARSTSCVAVRCDVLSNAWRT